MLLTKDQKKKLIDELSDRLNRSKAIVFAGYKGINVQALNKLRKNLKTKKIDFKVAKNSLLKLVLKNNNIKIDEAILDKQTVLAFGYEDEIEPNKIVYAFKKENEKLEILGAIVNHEFVNAESVKSLALMPSKNELYGKVIGTIAGPLSGLINVMSGNLRGLVSVLKQYSEKVK